MDQYIDKFPLQLNHKKILHEFFISYRRYSIKKTPYEDFLIYLDGIYLSSDKYEKKMAQELSDSFHGWSKNYLHARSCRMVVSNLNKNYFFTLKEKLGVKTGVLKNIGPLENEYSYNYQRLFLGWLAYHLDENEKSISYTLS